MRKRSIKPLSVKSVPQRTCVACGKVRPKRELVRLVRAASGEVEVDREGRKAGRGAYVCSGAECWDKGINKKRLEHALRTTLARGNMEQLISYGKDFR